MSIEELNNLIVILLRFSGVLIVIFNVGIVVILIRQISIMNKVIKGEHRQIINFIALLLLFLSGSILLYSILI